MVPRDDMLRAVPLEELRRAQLGRLVEPVVWAYGDSVDSQGGGGELDLHVVVLAGCLTACLILQGVLRLVSQVKHPFFGHMLVNHVALLCAEQAMG